METDFILIAAWLLVTIPVVEEWWFKYQLYKVKRGRTPFGEFPDAHTSYIITQRAGDFMKSNWSLMGRSRKRLRRCMTIAGYILATIYLFSILTYKF